MQETNHRQTESHQLTDTAPEAQSAEQERRGHSRRIAINTLLLSVRLVISMVLTFYTSRVVYQTLGVEDFGILNLISSLTSAFVFFGSSLSNATQRYLSYYLGRGDVAGTKRTFELNLIIYLALGTGALLLGEGIGYYLLHYHLNIPSDRLEATIWIYHIFLISAVVQLITTIYESVLIARENMRIYAWMGMLEAGLKLCIALSLALIPWDHLVTYSLLLAGAVIAVRLIPAVLCRRFYAECRDIRWRWDGTMGRELVGFMGWNGVGTAVWAVCNQGTDVLINIFLGPVLNAARGIAAQVSSVVGGFSLSFFSAARSRITMSYAAGDREYFARLLYSSSRYGYFIVWALMAPLLYRLGDVLALWLGTVPEETTPIVLWVLAYTLVQALIQPLWLGVQATGTLRPYIVQSSIAMLSAMPVIYLGLEGGLGAVFAFQILTLSRIAQLGVTIRSLGQLTPFPALPYLRRVIVPCVAVSVSSTLVLYFVDIWIARTLWGLFLVSGISLAVAGLATWILGTEPSERAFALGMLRARLGRRDDSTETPKP